MLGRRLLTAGRGGGLIDPVGVIRSIVSDITASDGNVYTLTANNGYQPHTIKVIDDGAGAYVAVAHWSTDGGVTFGVDVYTSTDLLAYTHEVRLTSDGALPTIGRRTDGSFVVGWQEQSSGRLRLQRFTSLVNLLAGTVNDNVLLPKTLATGTGVEQAPNIFTAEEPMDIGFVYNAAAAAAEDRAERIAEKYDGVLMRLPHQIRRRYLATAVLDRLRRPPPRQSAPPQLVPSPLR